MKCLLKTVCLVFSCSLAVCASISATNAWMHPAHTPCSLRADLPGVSNLSRCHTCYFHGVQRVCCMRMDATPVQKSSAVVGIASRTNLI